MKKKLEKNLSERIFSLPKETLEALEARTNKKSNGDISRTLNCDLETFYAFLEKGICSAKLGFNRNELCYIIHSFRLYAPNFLHIATRYSLGGLVGMALRNIQSKNNLDTKWEVDNNIIIEKLRKCDSLITLGLLELCRLSWLFKNSDDFPDIINSFRDCTELIEPIAFAFSSKRSDLFKFFPFKDAYSKRSFNNISHKFMKQCELEELDSYFLLRNFNDLEKQICTFNNKEYHLYEEVISKELDRQNQLLERAGKMKNLAFDLQQVLLTGR